MTALGISFKEMLILTKKSNERKQIVHCGSSSPKLELFLALLCASSKKARSTVNLPLLLELAGYLLFIPSYLSHYIHTAPEGVAISAKFWLFH